MIVSYLLCLCYHLSIHPVLLDGRYTLYASVIHQPRHKSCTLQAASGKPEALSFVHAAGEATGLPDSSVDLVSMCLVCHELPQVRRWGVQSLRVAFFPFAPFATGEGLGLKLVPMIKDHTEFIRTSDDEGVTSIIRFYVLCSTHKNAHSCFPGHIPGPLLMHLLLLPEIVQAASQAIYNEAFRILRPGGCLCIMEVCTRLACLHVCLCVCLGVPVCLACLFVRLVHPCIRSSSSNTRRLNLTSLHATFRYLYMMSFPTSAMLDPQVLLSLKLLLCQRTCR